MLDDEEVELVYIATPHSHHFEHARMSLLKGKAVLCEKAFTANARQAEELLNLAKEKELFITEAIWTRYMPLSQTINDLVNGGIIGRPMTLSANLGYPIGNRERLRQPALAGGALLDLGVYALNFASMVFGTDVESVTSTCVKTDTGVDAQNSITLTFKDGKIAVLHSSMRGIHCKTAKSHHFRFAWVSCDTFTKLLRRLPSARSYQVKESWKIVFSGTIPNEVS